MDSHRFLVQFCFVLIAVTEAGAKVALLIIDIQNCFLPGGSLAVTNGTQVIPVINNIRSQNQFALTVLTQDWHCPNHVSFASQHNGYQQYEQITLQYSASGSRCSDSVGKCDVKYNVSQILWPDHCIINSTSAEFSLQLNQKSSDIVVRKGYNCDVDSYSAFYDNGGFRQTELYTTLQSHGVTTVIVTGLALDYCVYYTAKDAKKLEPLDVLGTRYVRKGKAVSELPDDYSDTYLDYLPFIWKEAAMLKYTTMYAEDRAHYSTFNYLKLGFRYPPTDYYFRPFMSAIESFSPILVEQLDVNEYCLGNVEQYKLQITFFKQFLQKYKSMLRLAFSWLNQLTHDIFNGIEYADQAFADFFKWMKKERHLEHTILIVMSDHGFRLDDFSTTLLGRLESQQPFLAIYLPEKLKRNYPHLDKNMQTNTERLVTPFDLHQTIHDIIYGRYNGTLAKTDQGLEKISLFTSLPEARSCEDAGIPENYCVCNLTLPVRITLPIVRKLANFIVASINDIIRSNGNGKLCELLQLYEVREAGIVNSFNTDQSEGPGHLHKTAEANTDGRYSMVIATLPGHGLFEGMVDHRNKNMELVGKVARLNRYGSQSYCIKDDNIEQYCYCKSNRSDVYL
ncbi:hypothetical protein CHS0354_002130 [Potamilus streckersoni]|uniref:Isochorismatase-like domain-containing protein n=1 Tax=Potamilus streckersoni TaxID=2493646 RepID=A0AAE0WC31_9BIVA|nr:hypothetical protein CHS0354_002130 [Potamilus streckersoni]